MAGKPESDPFPTRNATSDQIRNFFAQFLTTKIVLIDEARAWEIANRWPHEATGVELWTFSLQSYRGIFGEANGMLLWSHVHRVTEDDKKNMWQGVNQLTAIEKNIIIWVFLLLAFFMGWIASYQSSILNLATFSCAFFSGFACWLWIYLGVSSRREHV